MPAISHFQIFIKPPTKNIWPLHWASSLKLTSSSSSSQLQRRRNFNWEFVYIADNSQLIELWDGVGGVQHFCFYKLGFASFYGCLNSKIFLSLCIQPLPRFKRRVGWMSIPSGKMSFLPSHCCLSSFLALSLFVMLALGSKNTNNIKSAHEEKKRICDWKESGPL